MLKIRRLAFFIIFLSSFFFYTVVQAALPAQVNGAHPTLAPMLQKIMPSIVNISVIGESSTLSNAIANNIPGRQRSQPSHNSEDSDNNSEDSQNHDFGPSGNPTSNKFMTLGSGVIVDPQNGYIVTNAHLFRDAKSITVTLNDGRQCEARLIGADPPSDIAVLQVKANNLAALPFANSDNLQVGDFVVAIGNPFGLSQTVTSGIVSALQRTDLGIEGYENFIQTDAPINPGNSGGALVNLEGKLVGINTAILAPNGANVGIGFAIPSNMAKSVMTQLIKYGSVRRGIMGVIVQSVTPMLADAFHIKNTDQLAGAIIAGVTPNSPAAQAGLQPGDIITEVDNRKITNAAQVTNIVGLLRVGTTVALKIIRNGKPLNIAVGTATRNEYLKTTRSTNPLLYGINLRDYNEITALHGVVRGVQITGMSQESPAWRALPVGLRPDDVIISANLQPVHSTQELLTIAKNSQSLLLNVYRANGAMFVVIK